MYSYNNIGNYIHVYIHLKKTDTYIYMSIYTYLYVQLYE